MRKKENCWRNWSNLWEKMTTWCSLLSKAIHSFKRRPNKLQIKVTSLDSIWSRKWCKCSRIKEKCRIVRMGALMSSRSWQKSLGCQMLKSGRSPMKSEWARTHSLRKKSNQSKGNWKSWRWKIDNFWFKMITYKQLTHSKSKRVCLSNLLLKINANKVNNQIKPPLQRGRYISSRL